MQRDEFCWYITKRKGLIQPLENTIFYNLSLLQCIAAGMILENKLSRALRALSNEGF